MLLIFCIQAFTQNVISNRASEDNLLFLRAIAQRKSMDALQA